MFYGKFQFMFCVILCNILHVQYVTCKENICGMNLGMVQSCISNPLTVPSDCSGQLSAYRRPSQWHSVWTAQGSVGHGVSRTGVSATTNEDGERSRTARCKTYSPA